MKTKYDLFFILLFGFIGFGKAQNNPNYKPQNTKHGEEINITLQDTSKPVYAEVDPEYVYGDSAFLKYALTKINPKSPCLLDTNEIEIALRFVVDKYGNASAFELKHAYHTCREFEQDLARVILETKTWKPGTEGGKAVKSFKSVTIYYNPVSKKYSILNTRFELEKVEFNKSETGDLPPTTNPQGKEEPNDAGFEEINSQNTTYSKVEVAPKFIGGTTAFDEFVKASFNYPASCLEAGITGDLQIKMIINTKGEVSHIQVIKSVANCSDFDAEAIRILRNGPKWIPGMVNGKFVTCYHVVTMHIALK